MTIAVVGDRRSGCARRSSAIPACARLRGAGELPRRGRRGRPDGHLRPMGPRGPPAGQRCSLRLHPARRWLAAEGDAAPAQRRTAPRWEVPGSHPVVQGVDPFTLTIERARTYSAPSLLPVARPQGHAARLCRANPRTAPGRRDLRRSRIEPDVGAWLSGAARERGRMARAPHLFRHGSRRHAAGIGVPGSSPSREQGSASPGRTRRRWRSRA